MRRILFLISDLTPGSAARQLLLLAAGLRSSFSIQVVVLGSTSPWLDQLHAAGVPVTVLDWRRPLDVRPVLALRRLVRSFQPSILHVWQEPSLVPALAAVAGAAGRLLLSRVLTPAGRPAPLSRWLFRRAGAILALGQAEAQRYRALGIPEHSLVVARPAVPLLAASPPPAALPGLPPEVPVVLGIGPFAMHKGFRELIWALDILLHGRTTPTHLVLVGAGPDEPRLLRFAHSIAVADHVHFLGACADLAPWLARSAAVAVPSLRPGGACAALEAMAAARPVVASRGVGLEEIVLEGHTGYLCHRGDPGDLARQLNRLLKDPPTRARFGLAGRERAAALFHPQQLLDTCAELYGRWPLPRTRRFLA